MTNWVTADLHLNHANILNFCPSTRPYTDVNEMNNSIIQDWNSMVENDDTVYILGDVCFGQVNDAIKLVSQLKGNKILIRGNHDKKHLKNPEFARVFTEIHEYLELWIDNKLVVMFHFPIMSWERCHYGSLHFHGHLHDKLTGLEQYRIMNVGIDSMGKTLMKLEDAIAVALIKEIKK